MKQRPYLNLGCGHVILPAPRPVHHGLVPEGIYSYPLWVNVDRNIAEGVDEVVDVFRYPWPWSDDRFDGALLAHIAEHIPHDIRLCGNGSEERAAYLSKLQDGWFAFWSELYRVLAPGATVYVLSPYAWSAGAITDPTHTRLISEHTFTHCMDHADGTTFHYENGGINFKQAARARFGVTPLFQHLVHDESLLRQALQTQLNVAYDIEVDLEVVK